MEKVNSLNTTSIQLISLDLDDTLLTNKKTISQETIAYLQRLRSEGMILVLNSGRFYHEIEAYAKQLKLDEIGGYIVCANGQAVHNLLTQERYEFPYITSSYVNAWLSYSKKHHLITYFHDEDGYHFYAQAWLRISFHFAKMIGSCLPFLKKLLPKSLFIWNPQPYPTTIIREQAKLCFIGLPFMLKKLENTITQSTSDYHLFAINQFSKEVVHHTISKKEAILYICEQEKISLSNVLAFGDSGNDLPLLTSGCIAYAMKNAPLFIQKQVAHTTQYTNDEDGVLKELKAILQLS